MDAKFDFELKPQDVVTTMLTTPETKIEIAGKIAERAVAKGRWTQEEADEFVAKVKERVNA
jgi:polyhydroxyalkanoate synthesis regulator phasin